MSKKIYYALVVVLLVIVGVILFNINKIEKTIDDNVTDVQSKGKLITGSDKETFSGVITAVDTGCFSDAVCSVTIDSKKIILVKGGRGQSLSVQVGKLIGVDSIGDLEKMIGQHANVYATTTPEGDYSLYGNNNYYVEVVILEK